MEPSQVILHSSHVCLQLEGSTYGVWLCPSLQDSFIWEDLWASSLGAQPGFLHYVRGWDLDF